VVGVSGLPPCWAGVSGWLIDAVSWRAIFLINPVIVPDPLGRAALRPQPPTRASRSTSPVRDCRWAWAASYALIEGPDRASAGGVGAGVAGQVCRGTFPLVEARARNPMLPLRYFRIRASRGANATLLVSRS
jgi:hypothetical protein